MVDESFDFASVRNFDFVPVPSTDGQAYESLETNYLRSAMTRELEARGMQLGSNPDVLVNFSISTQEKVRSRSVPSMGGYVGAYDYYDDVYYDGWARTHETRIDQYTEGQLNIDVIDPVGRRLVWQGSTSGRLTNEMLANARTTLNEAVTEIMGAFPIPLPGAE
jgi:hypothetical protein